jgi:hypothetical protein
MGNRRRVGRGTHRHSQEACRLSDPIEVRRVKNGRLEHVPNEPLAFDATVAGLRPGPWGWVSDHEGRDHHRVRGCAASPCRQP